MSEYHIKRDLDGKYRVYKKKGLFGYSRVPKDHSQYASDIVANNEKDAEKLLMAFLLEKKNIQDAQEKSQGKKGVRYSYDSKNDPEYDIEVMYRIVHSGKNEDKPYIVQRLGRFGWVALKDRQPHPKKKNGETALLPIKFETLDAAKIKMMYEVEQESTKDRNRRAVKIVKTIDSRLVDFGGQT